MDDDKIVLTFTTGTAWTFTPDDQDDMVMVNDADYLTFGFWLYKPGDAEDTHYYANIAMGSDRWMLDTGDADFEFGTLSGMATYRGNAAGKYVKQDKVAGTAEIGIFTAKAKLTADFGEDNEDGSMSGEISSFMSGGEEMEGWKVMLNALDPWHTPQNLETPTHVALAPLPLADAALSTNAMIGDTPIGMGHWSAELFGNGRSDDEPGSVAGMFDAPRRSGGHFRRFRCAQRLARWNNPLNLNRKPGADRFTALAAPGL